MTGRIKYLPRDFCTRTCPYMRERECVRERQSGSARKKPGREREREREREKEREEKRENVEWERENVSKRAGQTERERQG